MVGGGMDENTVVLIPEEGMFGQVTKSGQIKPEEGDSRPYPRRNLIFIAPNSDGCGRDLAPFVEHDHTLALAIRQLSKFFWDMIVSHQNKEEQLKEEINLLKKQLDDLQKRFNQHTHKTPSGGSTV